MKLSTNATDLAIDDLGLVEFAASYLNDRRHIKWSKAELIVYLNAAQNSAASKFNKYCRTLFMTYGTTPLVGGQALYSLPADMARFMGLEIADDVSDTDPQPLREILLKDKDFYAYLDEANQKTDHGFFFISGTTFELRPQVGASASGIARVHYVKMLDTLANDDDVSEIPVNHHEVMALGAALRGYAKKSQRNPGLENLYTDRLQDLIDEVANYSPNREETVEADHLDWGPSYLDELVEG